MDMLKTMVVVALMVVGGSAVAEDGGVNDRDFGHLSVLGVVKCDADQRHEGYKCEPALDTESNAQ